MSLRRPHLPILWQILLLVGSAVLLTTAAMVAITFRGPPPLPAPTRVEEIAAALQSGIVAPGNGRRIVVADSRDRPMARAGETADRETGVAVATLLHVPMSQVSVYVPERSHNRPGSSVPQELRTDFTVIQRTPAGWRMAQSRDDGTRAAWQRTIVAAISVVLAVIMLLAWWVAGSITRPLTALAGAARAARAGQRWAPARRSGSPEVATVEAALADFDTRHRDHFRSQTSMLAAIAHDLGTPLARLAFRIEALPEAARTAAGDDIELMRGLIADSLALARSGIERGEPVDLVALIDKLAATSNRPDAPVRLVPPDRKDAGVIGEPVSLQRLFQNLIDNAQRYAGGATLSVGSGNSGIVVTVDDDGPGIAPDLLGQVCEPFVRAEPSRNSTTGGHGLGLSIARTIAERHDGSLTVANRAPHGLRVEVTLPAAAFR